MKRASSSTPAGLNVKKITAYLKGQAKNRNAVRITCQGGSAKDCNFHPKLLIMVNLVFRYSVAWTLIHKMNNYNDYG